MARTHTGSCICGAVEFRVEEPLRPVIFCHCIQCRKTSGHFVAATNAPWSAVTLDSQEGLQWYETSESARRGFCCRCGSSLFWDRHDNEAVSICAGSLDGAPNLGATHHIHVATKGSYYGHGDTIGDGLPEYNASTPS
jgi:hypothetical protein